MRPFDRGGKVAAEGVSNTMEMPSAFFVKLFWRNSCVKIRTSDSAKNVFI
ncbi:hypothetical protein SAMN05444266_109187 [Chitinophaga jiangningensis]|uniref:Uncharacterized protein n=1 Tax=Chitinophaga jiangningensis TaxID=1419482 RepID=A0A1M7K7I0_9BACT|nr:hypothetical protein SAMN05444266_109187 [Chitinophaga jiangningensis]